MTRRTLMAALAALAAFWPTGAAKASYTNFESAHVHPVALTPDGTRLLAVNTPGATLEVFAVAPGGSLLPLRSIPVGLEPVSVTPRTNTEAWVVNHLSDSISIVNISTGVTLRTLPVGDEPTDVVFAQGRAFVTVSQEDVVKVFSLAALDAGPQHTIPIFSSDPRSLAVSADGLKVYAVPLHSGNRTTVVNQHAITGTVSLNATRLSQLGLNTIACNGTPPSYPPLPPGIARDPNLNDPAPPQQPPVGLIVKWDPATSRWRDESGTDWNACLPFRLPDHDLYILDAANPSATPMTVRTLGTTLFDVSVNPADGRIWVPHTEARNDIRFEHPKGVQGRMVENRMAVIDPSSGHSVTLIDLNGHIDPNSAPPGNLAERMASLSQPGMMAWNGAGTAAYLTAIGSRKLFRLDGTCSAPACIFGPDRSLPVAVEVGEGPTGVALHEGHDRAYVLNRFSNSIALVEASSMTKVGEVPLHDPSGATVRNGRRFLYDGILSSRHGDASCASCHIFGNMDEIAWDLGNPEGEFVPYGTPGDNVRFIVPVSNQPFECPNPTDCSAHAGFDPQKGPMATQTLRGMLEPLHWRGDRATMNDFNMAFPGLMGTEDTGPVNSKPAGLTSADMELFRQFALGIEFPPNPFRLVTDTLPNATVSVPGHQQPGNPAVGETLFNTGMTDANQSCASCHALPFGTAGGKRTGIQPGDPSTAKAALFNGTADGSPHSDLKVPHLRNMYEKFGPRFGSHTNPMDPPADQKSGFGFSHNGSIPDLGTFFSATVFTVNAQAVRDISMFMLHFPTGIRPSVGRHVTVPPGAPADPNAPPEVLVTRLIQLGNLADPGRHCELTAWAEVGPPASRIRSWTLDGGSGSGGLWTTDVNGEAKVGTATLRASATGPITFLCTTLGAGTRLGVDADLDGVLNGGDCSDGDPAFSAAPGEVSHVVASTGSPLLAWDDQSGSVGPGVVYEIAGGTAGGLLSSGLGPSTACLDAVTATSWDDPRPAPPLGEAYYYLVRARTAECAADFGAGRGAIEPLDCR